MPRIARLGMIAVGVATVVCVAACSSSNNQHTGKPTSSLSPTSAAPTSRPAPPTPTDHVEGMISSFSGNTINLRLRQGTATVDFSPSTAIIETSPAQLSDVTPGSCADVRPAPQSAPGAITAQSVTISPAADGKCPPLPAGPAGAAPPAPGAPPANPDVTGKVDSVSGNTIAVTSAESKGGTTQTTVTVTDTTTYSKATPTDTAALTSGKCMSAEGTKDSSGVLQATTIDLQPCPPMGGPSHRIPHIPHIPMPHHHHHG